MKKYTFAALSLILSLSAVVTGCGGKSSEAGKTEQPKGEAASKDAGKTKTIKFAHFIAEDHPVNKALNEKFKPLVEKNSNGTLKVDIFPNNKLGSEEQIYNGTRNGTIEMGVMSVIMESDVPRIGLLSLPFLFKDYNHAKTVVNGPVGKEIKDELEAKTGLKHLGYGVNGFRVVSSSKPLGKIENFKGMKLRMPNVPQMIAVGQALGTTVTPMPISEVFTALEQKVVDGQENPYAQLRASGWYEVQKNVLETRHMFLPNNYLANKKFWDSLTPEQQKVVADAAKQASEYEWELSEKGEEQDKKFLTDKGLNIMIPDENLRKQMIEATKPVYEAFYKKNAWAEESVKKIQSEAK